LAQDFRLFSFILFYISLPVCSYVTIWTDTDYPRLLPFFSRIETLFYIIYYYYHSDRTLSVMARTLQRVKCLITFMIQHHISKFQMIHGSKRNPGNQGNEVSSQLTTPQHSLVRSETVSPDICDQCDVML
jgi:hypothetical protein